MFCRWAQDNREKLQSQNSSLEFRLHKLQFIHLVRQGIEHQTEALHYAKNFAPFAHSHTKGTNQENMFCFVLHKLPGSTQSIKRSD